MTECRIIQEELTGVALLSGRIPLKLKAPFYSASETVRDVISTLDERRTLSQVRAGRAVCWHPEVEKDPLVTIRIATYNRGPLVAERALASACAQTYTNLEILVIGDNCNKDSVEAIDSVRDSRIRFINLPRQGIYPHEPHLRRKVAGAHPMNIGIALASGSWIAPCDDDDEMTHDHVEKLLHFATENRLEMVWSRAEQEVSPGLFKPVGSARLRRGNVCHGTVLYRSELSFMSYSMTCWKRHEPSDWNLWKRMQRIGVRMGFLDCMTYRYYLNNAGRARLAASGALDE